jgi:ureidoglycolate hydrolase
LSPSQEFQFSSTIIQKKTMSPEDFSNFEAIISVQQFKNFAAILQGKVEDYIFPSEHSEFANEQADAFGHFFVWEMNHRTTVWHCTLLT